LTDAGSRERNSRTANPTAHSNLLAAAHVPAKRTQAPQSGVVANDPLARAVALGARPFRNSGPTPPERGRAGSYGREAFRCSWKVTSPRVLPGRISA